MMESSKVKALLIRENLQGSGQMERYLRVCGCECRSAASYKEARTLLGTDDFDLVLSPMRLPDTSLFPLLNLLSGSRVTLFYWIAVDGGCLWLPALRLGLNCFGSAMLSTTEFVVALDEAIKGIRRASAEQPKSRADKSEPAARSAVVAV